MAKKRKDNGSAVFDLAQAVMEMRLMVLQNQPPLDIYEPYCTATNRASKELKTKLAQSGMQWWIPGPLNDEEWQELNHYYQSKGVRFPNATLFELGDADRDLSPYVMAWRVERGDILLTRHGLVQFGNKAPFCEATA